MSRLIFRFASIDQLASVCEQHDAINLRRLSSLTEHRALVDIAISLDSVTRANYAKDRANYAKGDTNSSPV